ncbi:MAG: hypothetical protein IKZ45_07525 [Fibrobacter sp.]|nr:hypothetical protein [Fibrobacter sp.]
MKKSLILFLALISIASAEKIKFLSEYCNVYFDTRTHVFTFDKKCLYHNGKKGSGFSFECRQSLFDAKGNVKYHSTGTDKVHISLSENGEPHFFAYEQNGEPIYQYNVSNFALDINSGVLQSCVFILTMKIEGE